MSSFLGVALVGVVLSRLKIRWVSVLKDAGLREMKMGSSNQILHFSIHLSV